MTDIYEILKAAGPGVSEGGLSDIEINNIEKVVGVKIPSDIRKFLSVFTFSYEPFIYTQESDEPLPVYYFYDFHDYENSVKQTCEILKSINDEDYSADDSEITSPSQVKASIFSEKRIYLGFDDSTGVWFIDLDPGEGGVIGQVVFIDFLEGDLRLTHKNFSEFLIDIVKHSKLYRNNY